MSPAAAKALSLSTDISTHSFLDAAKRAWILDDSSYLGRKEEGGRRKKKGGGIMIRMKKDGRRNEGGMKRHRHTHGEGGMKKKG